MPCHDLLSGCSKMDMLSENSDIAVAIRQEALKLGFTACGFATVVDTPDEVYNAWQDWIAQGKHASMTYMERYAAVRRNPQELLPQASTVISLALNYYPSQQLPAHNPRFAYYAYGKDYHEVMREKLQQLVSYIHTIASCECRICCDTAPIFERYWATRAGIGFVGRNSQLILPGRGSYFFLGEIVTTLPLPPSQPIASQCSECRRCIDACPVRAIAEDGTIDARRCISCQTIENRGEIAPEIACRLGRRVYGCDTCQEVCPHNSHATPTTIAEFQPREELRTLTYKKMRELTREEFAAIFRQSAVKRAKYEGLMRNLSCLDARLFEE